MSLPISNRLNQVRQQLVHAAENAGRIPKSITLVAVSKKFPAEHIAAAFAAGQCAFGENYVDEAVGKIKSLQNDAIEWHFIGSIQSNKTRLIARYFDWVQTIDQLRHAKRLNDQRSKELGPLNVCIQVNVDREQSKSGVLMEDVEVLAQQLLPMKNLCLRGLMAIPKATDDEVSQRQGFEKLAQLYHQLNQKGYALDTLSMGMSGDFEVAIAAGSTMVRIGSAIFGSRQ